MYVTKEERIKELEAKQIDNDLYKGMPGRHFTNSTGARMFERFCKKNKICSDIIFADYFYDEEGKSWLSSVCKNPVIKKTDGYLSIKNV